MSLPAIAGEAGNIHTRHRPALVLALPEKVRYSHSLPGNSFRSQFQKSEHVHEIGKGLCFVSLGIGQRSIPVLSIQKVVKPHIKRMRQAKLLPVLRQFQLYSNRTHHMAPKSTPHHLDYSQKLAFTTCPSQKPHPRGSRGANERGQIRVRRREQVPQPVARTAKLRFPYVDAKRLRQSERWTTQWRR